MLYSVVHLVVLCCTVLYTLWCCVVRCCAPCGVVLYSVVHLVVLCCTVLCTLWCCIVQCCAPCGAVLYSVVYLVVLSFDFSLAYILKFGTNLGRVTSTSGLSL